MKLIKMSDRIAQLEEALSESHVAAGNWQHHPLLCNDLRAIRYVVGYNVASEDEIPKHPHNPLENFGSLTISDDGETRFLGPSAGSEVCGPQLTKTQVTDIYSENATRSSLALLKARYRSCKLGAGENG